MGKRKDGLTNKMERFAYECATNNSSITAAYEAAYDCDKMSRAAMSNEASKLLARPEIALRIEAIKADIEARKLRSLQAQDINSRELVISKLYEWIENATPTDSMKIKSAELLGKSIGLWKDYQVTEDARSSDDIARQLEDRLANLLEGSDNEGVTSEQEQGSVH